MMTTPNDDRVAVLHSSQTAVKELSIVKKQKAIRAAFQLTCSPQEWQWSHDDQVAMAAYVLWAHQRLSAIEQIATVGIDRE